MTPQEHSNQVARVRAAELAQRGRVTHHDVYPRRKGRGELVPGAALAAALATVTLSHRPESRPHA